MTDKWLRSFILCAECKSLTKAAALSYISTTAISQQINLLENELDFSLFIRTHNGIRLTEAGESFYPVAKQILQLYEEGCQKGKAIENKNAGILKIAYAPNQFPGHLLDACGSFCRNNKPIRIEMKPLALSMQLESIRQGDCDLCFIAEPKPEYLGDCLFEPLYEDCYSFCMSPDNRLSKKRELLPEDLRNAHILCGKYDYLKQSFEEGLRDYCRNLTCVESEYNMTLRMQTHTSDDLFVIHSSWRDQYTEMLAVVDSKLPAGRVGVVYRNEKRSLAMRVIAYFRKVFGNNWR